MDKEKCALRVLVGIFTVLFLAALLWPRRCVCKDKKRYLEKLARQAARWSTAAKQDQNPMIAVLHANYGVGYLGAIGDIAAPEEVEAALGMKSYQMFYDEIIATQDAVTKKAIATCPRFGPDITSLTAIAGEGN